MLSRFQVVIVVTFTAVTPVSVQPVSALFQYDGYTAGGDTVYKVTLSNCSTILDSFNSAPIWTAWAYSGDSRFTCDPENSLTSEECTVAVNHLNVLNTFGLFQPNFVCTASGHLGTDNCASDIAILNNYIPAYLLPQASTNSPPYCFDNHTIDTISDTVAIKFDIVNNKSSPTREYPRPQNQQIEWTGGYR